jgi:hypothetical protein
MHRLTLVGTLAVALAGCARPAPDAFELLPKSIGGETLLYDERSGAQAADWARTMTLSLGYPLTAMTEATAFTAPTDREYQSQIIQIRGADGRQLVEPLIAAVWGSKPVEVWQELIGGKAVTRFLPVAGMQRSEAMYAYGFGDLAITILVRRPQEALDAIAAMP